MSYSDLYTEPLLVTPARGVVILSARVGPCTAAMTPEAALATAERLIAAAKLAQSDALARLIDF